MLPKNFTINKSQIQQIENLNTLFYLFFFSFLRIPHDFIFKNLTVTLICAFIVFVHKEPNAVENVTYNKLFHVTTSLIYNGIQIS